MGFYQLPETLDKDINDYQRLVEEFLSGELPKAKLKAFRVPMGIYEQRDEGHYMMRIRLAGGAITPSQLAFVAALSKEYSKWPLHFTTRQDVQIHDVGLAETVEILKKLKKVGLSSRGGGGNTVRNIMGNPDTGTNADEVFDVSPYVRALTTRLIAEPDSWTLPRKYKIAFSSSPADHGLATVNDLGFIARFNEKGEKGFTVYVAGGMGRKSRVGSLLYDFLPEDQVYNVARAVKNLFDKHGNRKNKHAARLRFLYEKLGHDEFIAKFESELELVRQKQYPPLELMEIKAVAEASLVIPLFLGDLKPEQAEHLADLVAPWGDETIRAGQDQNLVLRNIPEDKLPKLKAELIKAGILETIAPMLGSAVACAGASTCKLGICLSRGLLQTIRDEYKNDALPETGLDDISLKISGCPNSCGQHIIADIGLFGGAKRKDGKPYPFYNLVTGGVVADGKTVLAQKTAGIPARKVPVFLKEFFQYISETREQGETFPAFLDRTGREKLIELENKHNAAPAFEDEPEFYHDWYADKVFSLSEKLEGECSAGLFDLIELDLGQAAESLKDLPGVQEETAQQELLHRTVAASARALLMTKGLEPADDLEAVSLFREHFIGQHIDQAFSRLLDKHLAHSVLEREQVEQLYNAVRELYDSMDDSLRFPELSTEHAPPPTQPEAAAVVKDFRGVPCPMNFVKTKLVLESMQTGELLEVLLDNGEPIENVPASVKSEGHSIIDQKQLDDYWSIIIQKVAD